MKRSQRRVWVALAACLLVPILASPAWAAWTGAGTAEFIAANPLFGTGTTCDSSASTSWVLDTLANQHFTASSNSDRVPLLNFSIFNDEPSADTLDAVVVTSVIERAFSVERLEFWYDKNRDSVFSASQDSLMKAVVVTSRFETNDQITFSGLNYRLDGDSTRQFWITCNVWTDSVITHPTDFDTLGVGVHIFSNDISLRRQGLGPATNITNTCYPSKPQGYNIIFDTAPLKVDSVTYTYENFGGCPGIINLGDTLNVVAWVNDADTANVAANWPKAFLKEFGGGAAAKTMARDTVGGTYGPTAWFIRWGIPYSTSVNDGIDVLPGFYDLVIETKDAAGNIGRDSTTVQDTIDTDKPLIVAGNLSFDLFWDANDNDIVNVGDTIRVVADLDANDFAEITTVWTYIFGWAADSIFVDMTDDAGDRRFEGKVAVPVGTFDGSGPTTVQVHAVDNACNVDSAAVSLANDVDLDSPDEWGALTLTVLEDKDSNNCMGIGDVVRVQVENSAADLVGVFANMMSKADNAGFLDTIPPGAATAVPLINIAGAVWRLDWTLGEYPQDSAMDVAAFVARALVFAEDDAGNRDTTLTGTLNRSVDTEYPDPVEGLTCTSRPNGVIELTWDDEDADADWFAIFYDNGTGTINYNDTIGSVQTTGTGFWTTDGTVTLSSGTVYKFNVRTIDDCSNWERQHALPVACMSDATPPEMCVFQPDSGGVYGSGNPITVYARPNVTDPTSDDVESVWALGRLVNRGDGQPGAWHMVSDVISGTPPGELIFEIPLDSDSLDGLVVDGECKSIEIILMATDQTGNVTTVAQAEAACDPYFSFNWCRLSIIAVIDQINGNLPLAQPYCSNEVGFSAWGSENEVSVLAFGGGIEPYKARAWVEQGTPPTMAAAVAGVDTLFYAEDLDSAFTFNLNLTNYDKGEATLYVWVQEASGATATAEALICIPDSQGVEATIISPIDGKCIRRARSMADSIDIVAQVNPDAMDPDSVAKVDFEWALQCGETDDANWNLIKIVSGDSDSVRYWAKWGNIMDLADIEDGQVIGIRARFYDDQGNELATVPVCVCVDLDLTPVCLETENIIVCNGIEKVSGVIDFLAHLDGDVDDILQTELFVKHHYDPDVPSSWYSLGTGAQAVNNTIWRWDDIDTEEDISDEIKGDGWEESYWDFRVIATSIVGYVAYDYDGDGNFDDNTFDEIGNCSDITLFIDNEGVNVAIDDFATTIDGDPVTIQDPSCRLMGAEKLYSQGGNNVTVSANIDPWADTIEVARVEWWVGNDEYENACGSFVGPESSSEEFYVGSVTGYPYTMAFSPDAVPFVDYTDGYDAVVLIARAYDCQGNMSQDAIEWCILDIEPTEAIITDPMDEAIDCNDEITITATTLMNERFKKAVFYFREVGGGDWMAFDSTEASGTGTIGNLSGTWRAADYPDGSYEFTVVAEDDAGNRQELGQYITTLHKACGAPTVAITFPEGGEIFGCPLEVTATASVNDPNNYITEVVFLYQPVTSSLESDWATDYFSTDGVYSAPLDPNDEEIEGDYYIFAYAETKSGSYAFSEKVWVTFDVTGPEVNMIQVGGDRSNGGSSDPTVVVTGNAVDVVAEAWDRLSDEGYGLEDNCGLDSVKFYVENAGGTIVFGQLMQPVTEADNQFSVSWDTDGLPNGLYHAYIVASDGCCNNTTSDSWYVELVNDVPGLTISVLEAVSYCDRMNARDSINVSASLTSTANVDVDSVEFWWQPASKSDVYDQWTKIGAFSAANNQGSGIFTVGAQTSTWPEGATRLRAVLWNNGRATDDGNDSDTRFDDFTFNSSMPHHMLLYIDRSATDFTVDHVATLGAGNDLDVTVTPDEECDIYEVCYGLVTEDEMYGEYDCNGLEYSFDPYDSGFVSLSHNIWHGSLRVTTTDPLGNENSSDSELWILGIDETQAMLTYPLWGAYITDTLWTVEARKLSSSSVSSVEFFFGGASGAGTSIGTDNSASGDAFSATWNLANVADGEYYVWATAGGVAGPRCKVIVGIDGPTNIVLNDPTPNHTDDDGNIFVGDRVDLCVDRGSINSGIDLDSVVFCYRAGTALGVPDRPDPNDGWVRIDADRYGSMCVDWWTEDTLQTCSDGWYAIAAWIFDEAGNVNHSNIVHVYVDNTGPYSEIVDIDGDETFGTCHDVTAGEKVAITGISIDNLSCGNANSGVATLQFLASSIGEGSACVSGEGSGGSGAADIVFLIDYSGSMSEEIANVQAAAADFANSLSGSGVDFQLGLVEACAPMTVAQALTANTAAFISALNSAGCGGGVQSYDAMTQIADGTINVGWRSGAARYIVLITDTSPESGTASSIEFCNTPSPTEETTVANTMSSNNVTLIAIVETPADQSFSGTCAAEDQNAYDGIVTATNGEFFDLDASDYSDLFEEIAGSIAAAVSVEGQSGVGVVFGQMTIEPGGETTVFWNTTGLPTGEYCLWTVAVDNVGNRSTGPAVKVCVTDMTPPVAFVSGFGKAADEHMNWTRRIYARTWDTDVATVQFQWRLGETGDWVAIGIGEKVNSDSLCWTTLWNPCLSADGAYQMRVLATDKSGNYDASIAPILSLDLAECEVMPEANESVTGVTFKDKMAGNLGFVRVTSTWSGHIAVQGVYADMLGGLTTEKVALKKSVTSGSNEYIGGYNDGGILDGGTGMFWAATHTDGEDAVSWLNWGDINVQKAYPDEGFPGQLCNEATGACVWIQPEALSSSNGVVVMPAWEPILGPNQAHLRVWGNEVGCVMSVRFTSAIEGFNTGKYAKIKLPYRADAPSDVSQLAIAWWDGDSWNLNDGIFIGAQAEGWNTEANTVEFFTTNLYGLYAVVSNAGPLNCASITVDHLDMDPWCGEGYTGICPTIWTTVRSNVEGMDNNSDIDPNSIIVKIDGIPVYSQGDDADGWNTDWDNVAGILETSCDGEYSYYSGATAAGAASILPLSGGSHTVLVEAKNYQGAGCQSSFTFNVDATKPAIVFDDDNIYLDNNPRIEWSITDMESGVDMDMMYVDLFDITESVTSQVTPRDKWFYTATPSTISYDAAGGMYWFALTPDIVNGRRVRAVLYNGYRSISNDLDEGSQYRYDNQDGPPDCAGNWTSPAYAMYTIMATSEGSGDPMSYPNPFDAGSGEGATISFGAVSPTATATVKIYDLAGEPVYSFGSVPASNGSVTWYGSTDDGDPVAEGVYLCHVKISGPSSATANTVLKIVVKRGESN